MVEPGPVSDFAIVCVLGPPHIRSGPALEGERRDDLLRLVSADRYPAIELAPVRKVNRDGVRKNCVRRQTVIRSTRVRPRVWVATRGGTV